MDILKMQQCLGCRTSFQQNEKLPRQDMTIEYKRYDLPLNQKHKWILMRAVVAFLNCKGGTIFIGVQDNDRSVQGVYINEKEQDTFQQIICFLLNNIYPRVDLKEREQVVVHYVPVKSKGVFEGKYLIKMIVKQGNPSSTYVLNQKIKLQRENKTDQYNMYYGFYRLCTGNIEEIKDTALFNEMHKKACSPNAEAKSSHECNPLPPALQVEVYHLCFIGINKDEKLILEKFVEQLEQLDVEYDVMLEKELLRVSFKDQESYSSTKKFVCDNLADINLLFQGISFAEKGEVENSFVFENRPERKNQKKGNIEKLEKQIHQFKSNNKEMRQPKIYQVKKTEQEINSNLCYTFTHVHPSQIAQLSKFISRFLKKQQIIQFKNSLLIIFSSKIFLQQFHAKCQQKRQIYVEYGFERKIMFGLNSGRIKVQFYNDKKKAEMQKYIQGKYHPKELQFLGEGKKQCISVLLKDSFQACRCLDSFCEDKEFKKKFRIPGSQLGEKPKIKFFLQCIFD